jgi:hypothetical protein
MGKLWDWKWRRRKRRENNIKQDSVEREGVEMNGLQELTGRFISTVLNFTDPSVNLGSII